MVVGVSGIHVRLPMGSRTLRELSRATGSFSERLRASEDALGAGASNSTLAFIYIISPHGWDHSEQDVLDDHPGGA